MKGKGGIRSSLKLAVALTIAGTILVPGVSTGDTVEMRDGSLLEGVYMGGTQNSIRFQTDESLKTFSVADVLALTFDFVAPAAPAEGEAAPPEAPPAETAPAVEVSLPPTVPAGTRILVRTRETLDSKRHGTGHMFTAILEGDLIADGEVVAARGSNVYGRLTQARTSGNVAGKSELTIQLTDVMIDNRPHPITTSSVKAVTEGTGKSTVGRTAAGAAIGGLVKGSKGAKRGAAVGLGMSVLTQGNQINIPAGTVLEFQLADPFSPAP